MGVFTLRICFLSIACTSGQDYVDAERARCLMNTHWGTVWSNRHHRALSLFFSTAYCGSSSSTANSTFPGLGFKSQPRQFFRFFSFSQLSATVNQWRIFFEELNWLISMSFHWSYITKNGPDWDSNPRPGKRGTATVCCREKQGKRLMMPIASDSVPKGVH